MMEYVDRHGSIHTPSLNDIVKDRRGAFAIIIIDGKILVTAGPHAPDVPELPGGGIDEGESVEQAIIREIFEETSLDLQDYKILSKHQFDMKFYADDKNEYWNYNKQYFTIEIPKKYFFNDKKQTPEGGFAWWENINNIKTNSFRSTDLIALRNLRYL